MVCSACVVYGDDAHIFMTGIRSDEIKNASIACFDEVYSTFGLTYQIELSTMPEDHMGELKDWQFAEKTLAEAITEIGKDYVVNEGDGAFYGPKLDFHLADYINACSAAPSSWICSCRSVSSLSTPAQTARSTVRL